MSQLILGKKKEKMKKKKKKKKRNGTGEIGWVGGQS